MSYEKLRDMGSFTDAMFNRIIAFQERRHSAWNPALPFAERIKDLPLHYLIFSNADRDPARYRHTVAPYYPLRNEMRRIAGYARLVADKPVVADLDCGNGFIGSLIAREGVRVIGVRDPHGKPNQIEDFHDAGCYEVRQSTIADIDFPLDVAFSSWMPVALMCANVRMKLASTPSANRPTISQVILPGSCLRNSNASVSRYNVT